MGGRRPMIWQHGMRDLAAGSEIYHRPNSKSALPSPSHFCGKKDGRGKIIRWRLFETFGMGKNKSMKTIGAKLIM
jgi:hypothetical protein